MTTSDFLVLCIMGAILYLSAYAATQVDKIQEQRAQASVEKAQSYRKLFHNFIEHKKKKQKALRVSHRGHVRFPAINQ